MRLASAPWRHSASICSRLGICIAAAKKTASNTFSTRAEETAVPRAGRSPNRRSQTPCRDKPRTGAESNLAIFLFFEKPLQVDFADGGGGGIKAAAHLDLFANFLHPFRRDVESFWL